jgi:CHAT domain-containing protein
MHTPLRTFLVILFAFFSGLAVSQAPVAKTALKNALEEKNYNKADSLLQMQVESLFRTGPMDSLPGYIGYLGEIHENKFGKETAIQKINELVARIKSRTTDPMVLAESHTETADYLESLSMNDQAYKSIQQAYAYAEKIPGDNQARLGRLNSSMGTYAYRMGNMGLAEDHYRKALTSFTTTKNPNADSYYIVANNMGGIMWTASKMDSAIYFYNLALGILSKMPLTPINQYYRPAVLQNNMSALYNMQGRTTQAINALKSCIDNLRKYLSIKEDAPKRTGAVAFQFEATDNLAGIYRELGDYAQAYQLLQYSYEQKQKTNGSDRTGVYISQILLGQLFNSLREYNKAEEYLLKGLDSISRADGDFLFWQADASNYLALVNNNKGNISRATYYYEKADSLYQASLQGSYDNIYLEFLRNASEFYAKHGQLPRALAKANKAFNYVKQTQGTETLLAFYQMLNLSKIYLTAGNYQQALQFSKNGISIVERMAGRSNNLLDSIKTELEKPRAILLKTQAQYHLLPEKDVSSLTALLQELNEAAELLEKRKTIFYDAKDIALLVTDHTDLLNFIKTITLDLHRLTGDQAYTEKLVDLHESGMYTRIRSRLDKSDSIRFAHIPASVQQQEAELKAAMQAALRKGDPHGRSMTEYFRAVEAWQAFQETVKKQYPQYYKLRYESIFGSVDNIRQSIPAGTSLVRYLFVGNDLFAFVADKTSGQLVPLRAAGMENQIAIVGMQTATPAQTSDALHLLYKQLWAPLAPHIRHKKVIVIPDGILYALNFEILTPQKITSFDQLATHALIADHTISYHYSLLLVGQKHNVKELKDNFVAFAPGFLDEEKQRYRSSIKDSFELDQGYVSLLPQPVTIEFAAKASDMLGGEAYINDRSTAATFRNNAGRHRIIHIGTHAESNNLSPEFSRLIFSKGNRQHEQNSIFLHEIYNCDLSSELAVLTACESGKPGFQDGEGMISLAHAFNYAGSQSILTGLWKIDEQASAMLMERFYEYVVDGLDKDEALRKAKLDYLKNAKGRMLAPQYWAGLVLMGDTTPVQLEKKTSPLVWWIVGGVLLALLIIFLYKRKK